jgi:hypothetical protein
MYGYCVTGHGLVHTRLRNCVPYAIAVLHVLKSDSSGSQFGICANASPQSNAF